MSSGSITILLRLMLEQSGTGKMEASGTWNNHGHFKMITVHFKDVRSLRVNIDRALIFGYDLHEHFMQLILKFGQYLQHSLFIT